MIIMKLSASQTFTVVSCVLLIVISSIGMGIIWTTQLNLDLKMVLQWVNLMIIIGSAALLLNVKDEFINLYYKLKG